MTRTALIIATAFAVFGTAPASAQLGPPRTAVGAEHCVINIPADDALNVRHGPSASTAAVATHAYGDCGITVTADCEDGWCPVEDGRVAGWANARYIGAVEPPFFCVGLFHREPLPLRAYPDDDSRVIIEISEQSCDIAALPYVTGGWLKVRVEGREGWVRYEHLCAQ
jgi:SH3-like domain-containing protein